MKVKFALKSRQETKSESVGRTFMTENEHRLMVFMFTKQMVVITALIELLKSSGVLTDDDLVPFQSLVLSQEQANREILTSVVSQYKEFASSLGLEESLPR
jgi:hypothetical protein